MKIARQFHEYGITISLVAMIISAQTQPLVVREWGTFTSLQDEAGRTLGGINSDDEPVPAFCHDIAWALGARPNELPPVVDKGTPRCHPEVTMRLETPVLYFHLPPGVPSPLTASVKVSFRGGWLTQFYPVAETSGDSVSDKLTEATTGSLTWNDLRIGVEANGPETSERVWTAPRAVQAAGVCATNGESEQFLFYRGIGHLAWPLQVSRSADSARLEFQSQVEPTSSGCRLMSVQHLWLTSFRADGACAFSRAAAPGLPLPLFDLATGIQSQLSVQRSPSVGGGLSETQAKISIAFREERVWNAADK